MTEQPDKATTAVGELEVKNGVYKAYGQDLTLDHGRLIFAGGPIDNPGLDLKAFRKATDGTVAGINIAGTLRAPQATLYSDPVMDESDALAYLLLGPSARAVLAAGGEPGRQRRHLAGAEGGEPGGEEDRLALRPAGGDGSRPTGGIKETSLVVGKYLSPRLYVNYGLGLFQPINTFTIRYLLGRQWSLQAQQGAAVGGQGQATGVDILYTVERGKGGAAPPPPKQDRGEDVKAPPAAQGTGGLGR